MEMRREQLSTLQRLSVEPRSRVTVPDYSNNNDFADNTLRQTSNPARVRGWRVKLLSDRILAVLGLIVLAPVLLIICIAIKLDSPGPAFFRQLRSGLGGRSFRVCKFRSMVHNPSSEFVQATRKDRRVTRVGAFLRKTSLDELPNLFNVVMGDMSLVGPRPHAHPLDDEFSLKISNYPARNLVPPGITGWAQVNGCRGETANLEDMMARVERDLYYINNWSLALDLKILLLTVLRMFRDPKAY